MQLKKFPFEIILDWYKKNGRHHLPWRQLQSPYHVWISEIFLQQTQVSRVEKYFNNVVANFPNIESLAQTDYNTFFPYYEGLGYYSRARNMLKTAKIIIQTYNGVFPNDYHQLIELPGIGPYTTQAILAFGFGENTLAFDTNLEKIFSRYYFGSRFIKLSQIEKQELQKQYKQTKILGRDINAALMDFASLVDINNKNSIIWNYYPLKNSKFLKEKGLSEYKPTKKKKILEKKDANIIVIIHKNHKEYYSKNPDIFEAFSLGKSSDDHRHFIKKHFHKNYQLQLSIRPAYKKIASNTGNYFFYHAQIQIGNHEFGIFSTQNKQEWENNFLTI